MVLYQERRRYGPTSSCIKFTQSTGNKLIKNQASNKITSGLLAGILNTMPKFYLIAEKRKFNFLFLLVFIVPFFTVFQAKAQLDTEFWFAPPELTESTTPGTGGPRDRPIQLVVSTLEKPARIEILQPADLTFVPIILDMPANETEIVNLTPFINRLESKPENSILKTGLYIKATNSISAYYEIKSANNTDIFALKGANANGKKFYVPFQTHWNNATNLNGNLYTPTTFSSFDIVATDDSTFVTVTPTKDLIGHQANVPFTFMLNRGQVYSCRAIDRFGANHPAGSKIESTKEVAVTMKDDMLQFDITEQVAGADIAGDQLIPLEFLGTSYVLVKGGLNNNQDRAFIVATEDNTIIRVDGNPIPLDTLNEGEQYEFQMINNSYFLSANKKVGVLHISGIADQVAGAVIPALTCTGTNRIGFTRTNAAQFIINVITKNSAKNNFTLNGDPNLVPGSAFQPILGSNGWVYARINFSTAQIPAGTTLLLQNSGDELFHVGVTNYAAGVGSNYGYFSNFSRLNLGTNKNLCVGDTAVLDAGPAKTSYLWSTGATTRIIETLEPGKYWVNTLSGSQCPKTDTVTVRFYEPFFTLGPDDTICIGSTRLITPSGVFTYTWQDGSTQPVYTATQAGVYWAQVADFQGCTTRDSIVISEFPRPQTPVASIGDTVCKGGLVSLTMGNIADATYAWLDPDSTVISGKSILINTNTQPEGAYKAFIKINGCESFFDTSFVGIVQPPVTDLGKDTVLCSLGGSYLLDPGSHQNGYLYQWSNNTSDSVLTVTQSGKYKVTVSSPFGCSATDSVNVTFQEGPGKPNILPGIFFCSNQPASFGVTPQTGLIYKWTGPNGFTFTGASVTIPNAQQNQSGSYSVTAFQNGCPGIPADTTITINESPMVSLGNDTSSCAAFGLVLDPIANGAGMTYLWSNGSTDSTLTISAAGQYFVSVSNGICTSKDTVQVTFGAGPSVVTPTGTRNYCAGQAAIFGVVDVAGETYSWTGPNGFTFSGASISLPNVQQNQTGTYTVTPSFPGCPGTPVPFQLIVRPSPVINPMLDSSICPGSSIELDPVLNGGDETFYVWSNGLADSSITVSTAGTYNVTAFLGLCQAKDTVEISLKQGPSAITTTGTTQYCPGDTARFGVNPQTSEIYNWTGPNGFTFSGTNVEIPGLTASQFGTYTVTAVLGTCSGTPTDVSISQNATPSLTLVDDTTICGTNSISIDPVLFGNGYTYSWSNGSTDSTLSVSTPGKYVVTVSNGTCSTTDSVTVSAGQIPEAVSIAGQNSYCQGDNASLNITPQSGVSYTWTGPNGFSSVSTSISISGIQTNQAGFYSVVSTLNGCNGPSDTIQVTVGITPVLDLGTNQTLCDVPSIVLDPLPNSAGLTFSWNTGSTDTSLTVSTNGTYKVTVSDGTCSSQDSVQLTFGTTPAPLSITGTSALCSGESLNLQVTAQTGVSISWTGPNGFTSSGNTVNLSNIQVIQAGDYIVNANNNGCAGTGDTISVSVGQSPVIELGPTQSICNGSSVILDPVPHSTGLTYLWNTGSTDSSLTVSTAGQYSVIVSGGGTCTANDTIQVNAGTPPPAVTVLGDTINCTGSSAVLFAPAQSNVTYSWTGPNGFTANTDTIRILNLTTANAGQYIVTPTLGNCIGTPTAVNLQVGIGPIVYLGVDDTICGSTLVTLDPTNGQDGFSYEWNVGSTDSSIFINQSGQYSVTVRYLGCVRSDTVNLTFSPLPIPVTIEGDAAKCAGDSILLTLQGTQAGTSYNWTGPGGFTSSGLNVTLADITLANAGQYQVTPILDGCPGTQTSIDIVINTRPFTELGLDLQSCEGTSFTLDPNPASAGLTFLWNTGSTDTSIIVNQTGTYSVIVSNGTNCTSKDTIDVTLNPYPQAPTFTGDTVYCAGETGSFGTNPVTGATVNWTGPNGFTSSGETINIISAVASQTGYYAATLNAGGCLGQTDSIYVQVAPYPTVNLGPDTTFCGNESYTLVAGNGTQENTYLWNTGALTSTLQVGVTGNYYVTVSNGALCSASDTVSVTFKTTPDSIQVIRGSITACENSTVTFEVESQSVAQTYWTGPNGFTAIGSSITVPANGLSAGTYTVVNRFDGCSGITKNLELTTKPVPAILVTYDSLVCTGTKKPATAVATPGASIFWSNNFSGISSEFGVGTHWAEATLNGCVSRDTFMIRNSGPIANFVTNPDSNLAVYEAIQFIDKSVAGVNPISFWEWQLGNSQIRSEQNTSYTYATDGDFDIQLIVKDNLGCADTIVKTISLITPRGWFIPNLFTPNGDGDNDFFEVGDMDKYPGTKVTVFNRWGHEEFSSKDYKNDWDGGSLVNGVYFYNIERADGQSFTGYVNLRR